MSVIRVSCRRFSFQRGGRDLSAQTILTLSNGKGVDLLNVTAADIDFAAIAEHLAKEKRFNGATPDVEYSVAQHCSIGSDAILAAGGTDSEAAYFLLHDAHEAFVKDLTTPLKRALDDISQEYYKTEPKTVFNAFHLLEAHADIAIHEAAGLPWPMPDDIKPVIKYFDKLMFVTEWRDLMHDITHPDPDAYAGLNPLPKLIQPENWAHARAGWLLRANKLLPNLRGK